MLKGFIELNELEWEAQRKDKIVSRTPTVAVPAVTSGRCRAAYKFLAAVQQEVYSYAYASTESIMSHAQACLPILKTVLSSNSASSYSALDKIMS